MTRSELLLMAIPAAVALAGGVLAALWHPSHRARRLIQHFAAGVVLAALAVTPVSTLVLFGGFLAFWAVQLAGRA